MLSEMHITGNGGNASSDVDKEGSRGVVGER